MKIIIINGSARKGNTLTAINALIKGASEKNEIEVIEPDKLQIAPCKGCGACQCHKGCVDNDDTNPTIDKIAAADMILFTTPVLVGDVGAAEACDRQMLLPWTAVEKQESRCDCCWRFTG